MHTIYKYTTNAAGRIRLPKDAKLCKIAYQDGNVHFWFRVNTDNWEEVRRFESVGTGWDIEATFSKYRYSYIDTVTDERGYVWHWFELYE